MPLPENDATVTTAGKLVEQLKGIFGTPPGFRPAHAKGVLLTGTFEPTAEAGQLSSAPHLNTLATRIIARFSSSTGIPSLPDTDANGDPRGLAIRFHLPMENGRRKHTDIVIHSTPFFPTRTGEGFLEFLQALAASQSSTEKPTPIEKFLGKTPSALAFVQAPKPMPKSFVTEKYFGVTAFKFVGGSGGDIYFRYIVDPDAGVETLDAMGLEGKGPNFLHEELHERLAKGPVSFKLKAQLADKGDTVDDATVHWAESRKVVTLGTVKLHGMVDASEQQEEQKKIIFDPIPRVGGIEASADPLLDTRAAVYLISGRERRKA